MSAGARGSAAVRRALHRASPRCRRAEVLASFAVCLPNLTVMRWIALFVPLVVACIAALLWSQQVVLWGVTEPGMSVSAVRAALPEAVPPPQPKSLDNGLTLGLVAPRVSNLERAFNAELYFDDRGLQQVMLLPTRLLAPSAAMAEFEELRHVAARRYGRELAAAAARSADVPAEAQWKAGPVTVTLRVERQGDYAAVVMSYAAARRS